MVQTQPAYLKIDEAAATLRVTPRTVQRYIAADNHPLPTVTLNGRTLIPQDGFSAWLASRGQAVTA